MNDWASFITFTARRLWNSIPNALENQSRFDSPAFHTANTTSQVFPQLNQQRAQIWNGLCVTQTHTMAMHKIPHDTCKCRPAPSVLCPSQHWKLMSGGTGMKTGTGRVISLVICAKISFCSCLFTTLLCISVLSKDGPSLVFILRHQGAMFPFYPRVDQSMHWTSRLYRGCIRQKHLLCANQNPCQLPVRSQLVNCLNVH